MGRGEEECSLNPVRAAHDARKTKLNTKNLGVSCSAPARVVTDKVHAQTVRRGLNHNTLAVLLKAYNQELIPAPRNPSGHH